MEKRKRLTTKKECQRPQWSIEAERLRIKKQMTKLVKEIAKNKKAGQQNDSRE